MAKLCSLDHVCDFFKNCLRIAFISLLVSILIGCPAHVDKQLNFDDTQNSQYYLSQYSNASGSKKTDWQLLAIRALIIEKNVQQANQLFSQLPNDLNSNQQQQALLLQGEMSVLNGKNFDISRISFANLATDTDKIRYYNIKISLDQQRHDTNAQIRDYIELQRYGSIEQQHRVINQTWDFLLSLDQSVISQIIVYVNETTLQGWIDLIYAYRSNANLYPITDEDNSDTIAQKEENQLNVLKKVVREWQEQYSNHPAALYLPRTIYGEKYRLSDGLTSKNIALFLPMTGSSQAFGNAIYLGFSDANQSISQASQQNIVVYDTNSASIESLVQQAKQQGAELIVGPLIKRDVLSITKLSPSIPVLALNRLDNSDAMGEVSSSICFFALSPEDEAVDAANHIYHQNKKNPLLLVPRNDLGERVAKSFSEQWNLNDAELNGVRVQYFGSENDLSANMNKGVGIELEGSLITALPYQLNQQEDISAQMMGNSKNDSATFDAIYVYASHNELTLIKSMLEMKSNKKQLDSNGVVLLDKNGDPVMVEKILPAIYSSSRSNIENTTQDYRYDMDRVQFSDIPMIFNKNQLMDKLPIYIKNDYSLVRLYAMGIDARQLANQFEQLRTSQIDTLDGMTGKLSTSKGCQISRALSWHQYMSGKDVIVD